MPLILPIFTRKKDAYIWDFSDALKVLLGDDAKGLSANTISRLKVDWQDEGAACMQCNDYGDMATQARTWTDSPIISRFSIYQ